MKKNVCVFLQFFKSRLYLVYGVILSLLFINLFACGHQKNKKTFGSSEVDENIGNEFTMKLREGEGVFRTHCKNCHNAPGVLVKDGTNWKSIYGRVPNRVDYILEFICSSSRLRKEGDEYALMIKEVNGSVNYEHEFAASLSKEELLTLMVYLNDGIKEKKL